jgi:hypothetical protein
MRIAPAISRVRARPIQHLGAAAYRPAVGTRYTLDVELVDDDRVGLNDTRQRAPLVANGESISERRSYGKRAERRGQRRHGDRLATDRDATALRREARASG